MYWEDALIPEGELASRVACPFASPPVICLPLQGHLPGTSFPLVCGGFPSEVLPSSWSPTLQSEDTREAQVRASPGASTGLPGP